MIPHRLWRAADAGDRKQWQRGGKRRAGNSDTCSACSAARHRSGSPKVPAKVKVSKSPGTCATCDQPAKSAQAMYCTDCREKRDRELSAARSARLREGIRRAREQAGNPDVDHDSSYALKGGRWVTGRGPSGLPIQAWEAA